MKSLFRRFSGDRARDAARLALQSGIAAAAMYSLMEALALPERFVGVLSAVLVVQPTVGNTLGEAGQRVVATLIGSALGVVCLFLLPSGYGTAVALAVSSIAMHLVAGLRPEWRYGVVAAVALSLGSENEALATAIDRSIAIGLGVGVGALVTLVIWPDRATTRAARELSRALEAAAGRLHYAVRATQDGGDGDAAEARSKFHRSFESAREAVAAVRLADTEGLENKVEEVEKLYNSVLILNRVAEEHEGPLLEHDEVGAGVETIRRCGCELALALARGKEAGRREHLEEIRAALDDVRDAVTRDKGEHKTHVLLNALVFGLDEVEDSLSRLCELYSSG